MFKRLYIIVIFILVLFTSSCSNLGKAELLRTPMSNTNSSYSQTTGYKEYLDKLSYFSSNISAEYYNYYDVNDNLSMSPVSIYMALSLATECSNGETKEELLNALGLTYEEVSLYTGALLSKLVKERKVEDNFGNEKLLSKLDITNSIWIQNDLNVLDNCIASLADNYYCYPYKTDFYNDNKGANLAIKEFINEKTNGLINQNFNLNKETIIALINTLYLKDVWNRDDDLSYTTDKYEFINSDGSVKNTKLLQGYYNTGNIYEEETFTHFYTKTNSGYKLKFIVPNDGYSVKDVFTKDNIYKINSMNDYHFRNEELKEEYYTRCIFPEYKASCDNDITELLNNRLNIKSLFSENCDFSNITDSTFSSERTIDYIYCSKVIHKTELEVNKKGIEGAAVTIMAMDGATSAEPTYKKVYYDYVIDKSFGYVLTDSSDVILFSGVVNNI